MNPLSPRARLVVVASVLFVLHLLTAAVTADQNPFKRIFGGGDNKTEYQTFKDPEGRFELEIPAKDWHHRSSATSLAMFTHKDDDGPSLSIDSVRLVNRLTPGEVEVMPEMEIRRLRDRQSRKDFKSEMFETKAGKGVLIRYAQTNRGPESVIQYTIPIGQDLFRIAGVIPDKQMMKFEPMVMHMIQTFNVPRDGSTAKSASPQVR